MCSESVRLPRIFVANRDQLGVEVETDDQGDCLVEAIRNTPEARGESDGDFSVFPITRPNLEALHKTGFRWEPDAAGMAVFFLMQENPGNW